MDNLTVIEKGYTVIYDDSKGQIGFIGIDDHSGGYPFFSSRVEFRNVYKRPDQAQSLLESALKMNKSYGSDKVHFGTMRVVKMSTVFQEVDIDYDKMLYDQAVGKLTDAELDIVKRYIGEMK